MEKPHDLLVGSRAQQGLQSNTFPQTMGQLSPALQGPGRKKSDAN